MGRQKLISLFVKRVSEQIIFVSRKMKSVECIHMYILYNTSFPIDIDGI